MALEKVKSMEEADVDAFWKLKSLNKRNTKNLDAPLLHNTESLEQARKFIQDRNAQEQFPTDKAHPFNQEATEELLLGEKHVPSPEETLSKETSSVQAGSEELDIHLEGLRKEGLSTQELSQIRSFITSEQATTPSLDDMQQMKTMAERIEEISVMTQLSDKMSDAPREGVHAITLKLKPDHLGEVQIRMQVDQDVVSARIQVESQQVRQIVESNFQLLRDALQDHNLSAGALDVNVGGFSHEEGGHKQNRRERTENELPQNEYDNSAETLSEIRGDSGRRFGTNSFEYIV
ncbi:flagellar hook-length control protein FliK [Chitinivibrio alkaliphilus]|uniref:Flagellar hook-length control protein FliK n=1 Tax=Chitinivibrio alkaliphilus ACht1 TaxID=1313304 RepID=U7D816_9BACT|nr:flagellar hook-length control protein FliK [Chitinivibrio alkaliphilus]ERP32083.1 flagellar hook-length control protein FliK [Chitinivibrio alkaliphilus ACht1]